MKPLLRTLLRQPPLLASPVPRAQSSLVSKLPSRFSIRPRARQPFTTSGRAARRNAADDPDFVSIVDNPPQIVRVNRKHGIGLYLLALMPITAFALGTWQVQRLGWKNDLIARLEDRLLRDPLPLPQRIDPAAVPDFDFRRVFATGHFRHDQEMLVGPRMREGQSGFLVITPLEREGGPEATILVNRGWIAREKAAQKSRPDSLVGGEVTVEGLLREPWKKNMFTPDNRPDKGEFYFPDVHQMAGLVGSQPIWVESTMEPEYFRIVECENRGIPIGRAPEVGLRNNHVQYIVTWYGLALATSIMLYMVAKKPSSDITRRVRMNKHW